MVNFAKRFFYAVITEWRDQYIDYKGLYKQIKLVKAAVLELAQAYANIKVITGDDAGKEIQLEKMEAERKFWTMLDENVLRVETWYNKQIDHFTEQFHILTLQAIQLQLIDEYDPFTRGLSTRVERELDRLHLGLDIGLSTHTRKDEAKIPLYQENPLFPLSKKTSINDVIKRVRTTTTQRRMSMDRSPIDNYGIEDSGYIHDDDISSGDEDDSDVSLDESESAGVIPVGPSSPRRITSSIQRAKRTKPISINLTSTKSHVEKNNAVSRGKQLHDKVSPRLSTKQSTKSPRREVDSDDTKKPQEDKPHPIDPKEALTRSYTILKLRNLTKEDLESTDMTRSSFVVAKELEEMQKIDRHSAILKLQRAFAEFYRGISLLMNYATLNSEGIEKILTKHDKNIELGDKEIYINNNLSRCGFYKRSGLTTLMRETEHVFAMCFTSGHRTAAMKKLRVADKDKAKDPSTFKFGLLLGISLTFAVAIAYTAFNITTDLAIKIRPILMCYRMMAMICLLVWGWGVDMYIWAKYRVNYVFIFEFDPRRHHRYTNIFEAASVMTVLVIGSLMIFLLSVIDIQVWYLQWIKQVPMIVHPLAVFGLFVIASILYQVKSKMWLVKIVAYIFGSPFTFIHFPHFFIADQLVSVVIVLYDIEYFLCYLINDAWTETIPPSCDSNYRYMLPMLAFLPPFWRFMQCLRRYVDTGQRRQLANAGKYSVAFFVIAFSFLRGKFKDQDVFTALWIAFVVIGTVYSYYWDIKMDWSLGETKGVKHWGLRGKLLYPTYYYYFALISNFIMRVLWTLTISPEAINSLLHPDLFTTLLAAIEIYRRCLWNLFRVENEQLNNIGKFRALNDMPLPLPVKNPFEEENEEIV